jgi:hypothetical protein
MISSVEISFHKTYFLDPAREKAGIIIKGKDTWLMKKSIQYQKAKTSTNTL